MATRKLGKYEIIERLGRGGMAEVYRAYHQSLDRFVAIKVLHSFLADDPEFKSRFEKEARNIARLKHPHIVSVYDFENDADNEKYYMVMELIEGATLKDVLTDLGERNVRLPLADALRIVREAASALAYAHAQGMIHRDVKPANLMIDRENRVVLTDFGIAKIVTGAQFTASGGMIGTPAYMAPEQGLGDQGDERSDLYSLGIILFQLISGRLPYEAETPLAVILKHLNEPVPAIRSLVPDVPDAIEAVINRLIAKDPDARYQTANALIADLERIERALALDPTGQHIDEHDTLDLNTSPQPDGSRRSTRELLAANAQVGTTTTVLPGSVSSAQRRGGWLIPWLLLAIVLIGGVGIIATQVPGGIPLLLGLVSPTPTPTLTTTPTETAVPSDTPSVTPIPSATDTETPPSDTPEPPPLIDPTLSESPVPPTLTITRTPVSPTPVSPTPTPTQTTSPTRTPVPPTPTATLTSTFTPSATRTPSHTRTFTFTPTYTPSHTLTPSFTPSNTRRPTSTPTPTITLTPSQTFTPTIDVTQTLIAATLISEFQTATAAVCDFNYAIVRQEPPDATFIQAGTAFTRTITLRNTGECAWDRLTALNYVSGENFGIGARIVIRDRVERGEEITLVLTGQTPRTNGLLSGLFELRTSGQLLIGAPLFITINVFGA